MLLNPLLPTTPIRPQRRKRISISPKKKQAQKARKSDPYPSQAPPEKTSSDEHVDADNIDIELDFSYWNAELNQFQPVDNVNKVRLLQILRLRYPQVEAIMPVPPFLVIECADAVPPESEQPFMVAGLVAVFMAIGEPYPFGLEFIGENGGSEMDARQSVPDDVYNDLRAFQIPKMSTFKWLHKRIPNALFVSSYPQQLVVELSESDEETFEQRIQVLPERFGSLNVGYINGSLIQKRQACVKAPDPRHYDSTYDDTNYLLPENGGTLRPGVLLECIGTPDENGTVTGNMLTNAGVKVVKGDDTRFTVAYHGWDGVTEKDVYHGSTNVGTISECLGEDIGLVQTNHPFTNQFLDLGARAQRLYHSSLIKYGEYVVIDSAFTSRQRMRVFGVRTGLKRQSADYVGPRPEFEYVYVDQGILSVKAETINTEPQIREGVSGTPIILQGRSRLDESYLALGRVVGFMLYTDVRGFSQTGRLYSYCQPPDPLIEAGWEVCM